MTFKGQRNRHSEGSKKAGGRESEGSQRTLQQPPGATCKGQGSPSSGPWDGEVREDLEKSWHGAYPVWFWT